MGRDDDDGHVGALLLHPAEELHAVEAGHAQIRHQAVEGFLLEPLAARPPVKRDLGLDAVGFEILGKGTRELPFIVDYQDPHYLSLRFLAILFEKLLCALIL